jgi:hypothetical protein
VSRFKTIAFWLFLTAALGTGIYVYFNLKSSKKPQITALSVLPDSCLVYLNTNDLFELNKKINSQSLIADKLNLFPEVRIVFSTLQEFDSIFNSNSVVQEVIEKNLIHFAYYSSGFLISFNLKQLGDQDIIKGYLAELFNSKAGIDGVYDFKTGSKKTLHFQLSEGLVLVSDHRSLIAKTLDKTNLKLERAPSFADFKNTLSQNNLVSIYVNHSLFEKEKPKLNLNALFENGISAASIEFTPSQVITNGFFRPEGDQVFSYLTSQESQASMDISEFLPSNTVSFKAFAISDYDALTVKMKQSATTYKQWETFNLKALYNLKLDFENNVGAHVVQFKTLANETELTAVEIIDTLNAREQLLILSDTLICADSVLMYKLSSSEYPAGYRLFEPLLSNLSAYAAIYSSHIYFAENAETLLNTLNQLKSNRSLNANISFVTYMNQHFPDEYNFLYYNSPNKLKDKIPTFFNFNASEIAKPFTNFKHFSYCLTKSSGQFKFRFHLLHESENRNAEQNILWTLRLDTLAIISAQGFVNHVTNENEILIQDKNNSLYLINAKGTVLWKKKITEKIQSKIYTVDIYKNGKFQVLFNTKKALHLIDRNGNYVENYPITLASEASNSLSLFDYEADKDYRILIACKNKSIYNYNIHGVKQEKFNVVKTDNEVHLAIQYVKIGLSDYLVAMDEEGKIYTFSRKGVGRIGLRNRSITHCKAFYCDLTNTINGSYIVYIDDKNGHINKISFDDRKEIIKLNTETENTEVKFRLIDDNRSMDLMFTKNSSIWSYNFSGNLISETNSNLELKESDFYKDESHSFYYSLSADQQEITLNDVLNQKTKSLKGTLMPYITNLFKDNKKYLILSNGAQLSCVAID